MPKAFTWLQAGLTAVALVYAGYLHFRVQTVRIEAGPRTAPQPPEHDVPQGAPARPLAPTTAANAVDRTLASVCSPAHAELGRAPGSATLARERPSTPTSETPPATTLGIELSGDGEPARLSSDCALIDGGKGTRFTAFLAEGENFWCENTPVAIDLAAKVCRFENACYTCENSRVIPPRDGRSGPSCANGEKPIQQTAACCVRRSGNRLQCPALRQCFDAPDDLERCGT